MSRWLLLLVVAPLFVWRIDRPGFSDTEGMFAEPAREMVVSGDWITPTMNGEPFLVKPPLMYWLPAAVFSGVGPTEYARVVPLIAALATVAVTAALGTTLAGPSAGIAAGAVLATSFGFFVESRMLRADMILMLSVAASLWAYVHLRRAGGIRWALLFWTVLGIGMLDKGLLAVLLPGAVIAVAEIWEGLLRPRTLWARLRALHFWAGVGILAAVAVPWHVVAGARNPGFLWDYVVNQHLLFFFDEKLPRDSIPDALGFFWTMFVVRGLPWSLLLPAAVVHGWRTRSDGVARLPLVWVCVVLVLFSLAAGRLEHYSLPALPATALLVGRLLADIGTERLRIAPLWLGMPSVLAGLVALGATAANAPALLGNVEPSLVGLRLDELVRPAMATLGVGFSVIAACAWGGRGQALLAAGTVMAVVFLGFVQIAHERVESLFSWRPFAHAIRDTMHPGVATFFRASDEYQLCGGLDYYLERHVALLAPPSWVAPTFLEQHTARLFTPATTLAHAWQTGDAVFVSDDVDRPGDEAALVPGPYVVMARFGTRVLLRPLPSPGARYD